MLKLIRPDTAIRIRKKSFPKDDQGNPVTVDDNGHPIQPQYVDIIDEDILCEWQNKFGNEIYQAAAIDAKAPARIRLWYLPGIDATCQVIRVEDGTEFEIIGEPDDVKNRHQQLEMQLKRYVPGR